jgi:hypothetical protein
MLCSSQAKADFFRNVFINEDLTINVNNSNFVVININKILIGDLTIINGPLRNIGQPGHNINPFPNPMVEAVFNNDPMNPQTTVTFRGTDSMTDTLPTGPANRHIGFQLEPPPGTPTGPPEIVENPRIFQMFARVQDTTNPTAPPVRIDFPVLNTGIITTPTEPSCFVVGVAEVRLSGAPPNQSVTEWFEFGVQTNEAFTMEFDNPLADPVILSNVRFFPTCVEIPLGDLNRDRLPPSDPRFIPVPGIPDGTMLAPGGRISFTALVPEPSTTVLLGTGLIVLLAYGWRRRKQAA